MFASFGGEMGQALNERCLLHYMASVGRNEQSAAIDCYSHIVMCH